MITHKINVPELSKSIKNLKIGDRVLLSGTVYTARDAAHKRIFAMLESGEKLPFEIKNAAIYYAGPTPTPDNLAIGSCGPTTSSRMDPYTTKLLDLGLKCIIGKGNRSDEVCQSLKRNGAVYLCAIGGCGALYATCIKSSRVIAFDDLGCESVKELVLEDFPLIVGVDSNGDSLFNKKLK
ncbi:MAG: fumarate hydratase C-terminal domain-containing protein [Clostridia bacterium]|nr:fumarate hydratase C-terminal domain-containing protein [Clostridia bacterium]